MDGLEFLKQARAIDGDAAVLVLTGVGDVKTAIESLKCGAYDFIMKPVNVDELLIAAERALERRQLLIERREYHALLERRVAEATRDLAAALRELEDTYRTTLEALGSALDTRDVGTARPLAPRARLLARHRARPRRARERSCATRARRAAPRHRQDRHPRRHPAQAGAAHAGGVEDHAHAPRDRPPARRAHPVPAGRGAHRLPPPRALGRHRLPARARAARRSRSARASSRWPTPSTP